MNQNGSSLPNNNIKNYNTRNDDGGYLLYFEQLNGGHGLQVMADTWIHSSLLETCVRYGPEIRELIMAIIPMQDGLIQEEPPVNCLLS